KDKPEPKQPIKDKPEPKQPIKDKSEPKQPIKDKPEATQPIKDKPEATQPIKNKTEPMQPIKEKTEPTQPIKEKSGMVIRGVTFYKAEEQSYKEEDEEDEKSRGTNTTPTATKSPGLSTTQLHFQDLSERPSSPAPTQQPTAPLTTTPVLTTTTTPVPTTTTTPVPTTTTTPVPTTTTTPVPTTTIKPTTELTTNIPPTTPKPMTTKMTTTPLQTTLQPSQHAHQHTTAPSDTIIGPPIDASPTAVSRPGFRTRLVWTESPADQPKTTKKPAVCKDTVASISEPVQHNSFGSRDGSWMRDARGHGNVIYLTNGHYGNNLLEFRDMDTFKSGQASNSYKLPYSFTGTGHVVYNGAFYYNRAFSRDIIRYDLRHRYVAAWTTLHDALLEEQAHRTQTE
ncbi:olfactomedin-like protein 2B, partial [Plectropomus leopardus]|uniref:olfactomedin-like protein 2B n=1 Tax=Plectropomus leopardus TaxID=160734 RepID=UPI001C4D84E5